MYITKIIGYLIGECHGPEDALSQSSPVLEVLSVRTVSSQTNVDLSSIVVSNMLTCIIPDKILYRSR